MSALQELMGYSAPPVENPLQSLMGAFEAAAQRQRNAVMPQGGRREGWLTENPDFGISKLAGHIAMDLAKFPAKFAGMSEDLRQTGDFNPAPIPELWGNVLGVGALAGAPAGAVASGAISRGARDPDLWHGVSKIKLPKPISEMQSSHVPTQALKENVITPSDLQGGVLLPALGDRSVAGSNLTGYNGYKFIDPVEMQGGHGFMAAQSDKNLAWASGSGVASRIASNARKLGESGPVYFPYTAMGERSVDFSHHVSSSLAEALKLQPTSIRAQKEFDAAMRRADSNFPGMKDWPGVGSPNLRDWLETSGGDARNKFAKLMDSAKFQSVGFPSVAEARHAVTDPRLLNAPTGASGLSIAELDPSGKLIRGSSGHRTYDTDIGGKYIGGLGRSVPKEVMFPDLINAYKNAGYTPNQYDYLMARGLTGAPIAQKANQKWVDRVSNWMEKNPKEGFLYSNATDRKTGLAALMANEGQGIRAYHGSPHDFDRFDASKIGTGEGAQAYGHGLYFAENPKVAESYKMIFARNNSLASRLGFGPARELRPAPNGRMYEVNINARPEQFLDWDKPLRQQSQVIDSLRGSRSPKVREIARDDSLLAPSRELYGIDLGPYTGEDLYKRISLAADGRVVSPSATPLLKNAGIPGIKYLDQGSRAAGDGSRNYVVFDDKLIDILRKYGLAGASPLAALMMGGGDQAQAQPTAP